MTLFARCGSTGDFVTRSAADARDPNIAAIAAIATAPKPQPAVFKNSRRDRGTLIDIKEFVAIQQRVTEIDDR